MAKTEPFEKYTSDYENWFEKNAFVYAAELEAVRRLMPKSGEALEVGVGSGRFAAPLGIGYGIEPSEKMAALARQRGIDVSYGLAENLPFPDRRFDVVLMVTTICFVDDIARSFREAFRVLKSGGVFIVGYVDRESSLGKKYLEHKEESLFYRVATFYSTDEVIRGLEKAGFDDFEFTQTIFHELSATQDNEPVRRGYGTGSFVAVRGIRSQP